MYIVHSVGNIYTSASLCTCLVPY